MINIIPIIKQQKQLKTYKTIPVWRLILDPLGWFRQAHRTKTKGQGKGFRLLQCPGLNTSKKKRKQKFHPDLMLLVEIL